MRWLQKEKKIVICTDPGALTHSEMGHVLYSYGPLHGRGLYSYGLYSYGLYGFALNSYGLYSYGLYSYVNTF